MKTSQSVTEIFKAYTECAPELVNVAKDMNKHYKYTSLDKLIDETKPILAKHGLAIIQLPTGSGLITRMIHASGEWFEVNFESETILLNGMNAYQSQGSQITYIRRYAWASVCGIASEEDTDANGVSYSHSEKGVNRSNVNNTQTVNHNQVKLIQTRISKLGIDEATVSMLKSHYNIDSWNDLPAKSMNGLLEWFDKQPGKTTG